MAITVTKDTTDDPMIEADLVMQTIEKNRDRLRTTSGMIMSLSGMSISASLAIVLFLLKEHAATTATVALIVLAAISLFVAAFFAIEASFFRNDYAITTRSQFLSDLLRLLHREMRLVRWASVSTLIGLGFLALAVAVHAIELL